MAKYDITYACGHEETVRLTGPTRDREWHIERLESRLCDECWRAEQSRKRTEENAVSAAANAAAGLSALVGTDKQTAWAETIRQKKLTTLDNELGRGQITDTEPDRSRFLAAVAALRNQPQARWWIDNRDEFVMDLLAAILKRTEVPVPDEQAAAAAEAEAKTEATLRPETPLTETVAEIRTTDTAVWVVFPERRDDFRELVRIGLGYKWTGEYWQRTLVTPNGTPTERAVELGCKLLRAGFVVRIYDQELRDRVIHGEYEQEHKRWIQCRAKEPHIGWLSIGWPRTEDFYTAAKRISGSRYLKPNVIIPV